MTGDRSRERRRVTVRGVVQGVGFRPFVYTLAEELGLTGWVTNNADGVVAEVEGPGRAVADFCTRIAVRAPAARRRRVRRAPRRTRTER